MASESWSLPEDLSFSRALQFDGPSLLPSWALTREFAFERLFALSEVSSGRKLKVFCVALLPYSRNFEAFVQMCTQIGSWEGAEVV